MCDVQADAAATRREENVHGGACPQGNMILTADSSAQDTPATSAAFEALSSGVSSPDSRESNVPRISTQGLSSSYHVVHLTGRQLSPNMPTMDSTVSSAKPEPELNIGTGLLLEITFLYIAIYIIVCL